MKIIFLRPNVSASRAPSALQPLAFAVLAGSTPDFVDLEFYDECLEEIPMDLNCDAIAMTVQTFTANRSYYIADHYRKKGIPVVMGGYHPTFMPDEALLHSDAVVIGEAENIWKDVVNDLKDGKLKKKYCDENNVNLQNVKYERSIFKNKKYPMSVPIEFSRGCKFSCDFCSVSAFHKHTYKSRPVDEVIEEIKGIKSKYLSIVDDNLFSDEEKAKELFRKMIPLKKKWGCQISIDVAKDDETLELLSKSGCIMALIGFESLNETNLRQMRKASNIAQNDYIEVSRKLKKYGIMIYGSFVFGYDDDTIESFDRSVDFAMKSKFFLINLNTLNPLPGTHLYNRLLKEGRLFDENWWTNEKYKYGEIMFQPKNVSAYSLKNYGISARSKFFRLRSIFVRALDLRANCKNFSNILLYFVGNFIAKKDIMNKMKELKEISS